MGAAHVVDRRSAWGRTNEKEAREEGSSARAKAYEVSGLRVGCRIHVKSPCLTSRSAMRSAGKLESRSLKRLRERTER